METNDKIYKTTEKQRYATKRYKNANKNKKMTQIINKIIVLKNMKLSL